MLFTSFFKITGQNTITNFKKYSLINENRKTFPLSNFKNELKKMIRKGRKGLICLNLI